MAKQGSGDDSSMWIAIGCALAFIALVYFWGKNSAKVYTWLMTVASHEAWPFASFPFMDGYHRMMATLDPATMTLGDMNNVMNAAGRWYAWIIAPFCGWLIFKGMKSSARENYRRKLNMDKLLANNAKLYPCIAPILNWGNSLLKEKNDSGPWMTARQPIQFVAEKGLLENVATGEVISPKDLLTEAHIANPDSPVIAGAIKAKFNRNKATDEFRKQFSDEFRGLDKLPPYMYALCAAFLLFGTNKKDDGQKILDNMSVTFRPPRKEVPARWSWKYPFYIKGVKGRKSYSMSTYVHVNRQEILKLFNREDVQLMVRPHNRYRDHVVLALYAYARKKGVLSTAEFIWLRPVNRRLFYLLNNHGRRTSWVEVAGPVTHYSAEELLGNNNRDFQGTDIPPQDKLVRHAVNALELAMFEEGWVSSLQLDLKEYGRMDQKKE